MFLTARAVMPIICFSARFNSNNHKLPSYNNGLSFALFCLPLRP